MTDYEYPIYSNLWFWLIVIGFLFLTIGLIIWDVRAQFKQIWWVWALIFGGLFLLIAGLVIAIWPCWRQYNVGSDPLGDEILAEEDYPPPISTHTRQFSGKKPPSCTYSSKSEI
jgi:hypothetical protein